MSFRKHPLVVEAAACAGVSNAAGGRMVTALLDGIARALARGDEVRLGRFGSFVCEEVRPLREDVPPPVPRYAAKVTRRVRFRPGRRFRDALGL